MRPAITYTVVPSHPALHQLHLLPCTCLPSQPLHLHTGKKRREWMCVPPLPPSSRAESSGARACVHRLTVMANEAAENRGGTGTARDANLTSSLELSSSLDHSVQTRIFKIIVIGDSNVGKTCLTFRFTGGSFPDKTEATIGVDFREKAVEIEGEKIKVQVWDTAGQERFRKSMVEHYYRNVHAVVFVYDVTKMASFENLKTWIQECNGHRVSPSVPRVLVGNKCDLVDQIQVPSNTALKFADAHNMLLFETSAKDPKESQNVDSIFMCLACRLKAQKSLLYRDVQREDGRVRLSHEPEQKSTCPC
ncbi:ras-related protein Rab-33A [Pygocentrus nattereri]|uniref:small monomeric GTPase n=1 Tax=Pygocentrus nattereri TaxID=42514 RepID=A0A3B4CZL7_PYGNA|nr:ras-related protein Rab-33A [Pygocentrus nattereri]